ncbi:MAG: formylglycine-generating enzyme family protein [Blastocatellia bacterium]
MIRQWTRQAPRFAPSVSLERLLDEGKVLLLLDALNEMPHRGPDDYEELLAQWQAFVQKAVDRGNRILFSCRKLDYSAGLSSEDLRIPQIEVLPMTTAQVRAFLAAYAPKHQDRIWKQLDDSSQLEFFQTPYFLKLLCDLVDRLRGELPKGRASLFTEVVRQAMDRQREKGDPLFKRGGLLDDRDCDQLSRKEWRGPFDLPERGPLIRRLSDLAWRMQERRGSNENSQVRVRYKDAPSLLDDPRSPDILKAGLALNVLDDDLAEDDIRFYHQLLQEYFAARRLAREPKPEMVHVEWAAEKAQPSLAETLAGLNDGDPLPPIAQTGWEETTLTAAPMAENPAQFIRALIPENLPLAARCAASPELTVSEALRRELQQALLARSQDQTAYLRARIAAGEALGLLGDPRFEKRSGPHGDYLLPPLIDIPGGTYPMGDENGTYGNEKPACEVRLAPFQIGQFPVTNAEYKLFLDAGGYEQEEWWDTPESQAWLRGEASTDGQKLAWREHRERIQNMSEEFIRGLVSSNRITTREADDWIIVRNWTDEEFENWLEEQFPSGEKYRLPRFWDDIKFNHPAQPVVGITWFEARAYCNWLTASVGADDRVFRLPTEAEYEAAARGTEGRLYAYGNDFDSRRCNTFESHIRRTTPIGIFDNATPEGAYDLTGNVWTWTLSIYDQDRYPYPYRPDDGREAIDQAGIKRVLRGGSWRDVDGFARAVFRLSLPPAIRNNDFGFRVWCLVRPPSS